MFFKVIVCLKCFFEVINKDHRSMAYEINIIFVRFIPKCNDQFIVLLAM